MQITKEDLEDLLKAIKWCAEALDEDNVEPVRFTLNSISSHLENNLINNKIRFNKREEVK